jgi:diguanylate cyclase (GGDEF)-like protein/putative nucleotidyltransferase with HDIG domain
VKDFSIKTRIYIWVTLIAGALLVGHTLFFQNLQQYWLPAVILSLLASFTLLLRVEGATSRTHYNIAFLIYGFSIVLYGAPVAVAVMLISHIVEWIWHKYPWYIQLFNLASYVVVAVATGLIFEAFNLSHALNTWEAALSTLAAMICFTLLNHLMIGLIVWLARGENFAQSGIFDFFSLAMDCIILSMGAGAGVIWSYNPLATILVLLPLYLVYTTLRVPALERQSETDPKTGVFNHRYFEKNMNDELRRAERFDRPMTIVMADLDLLRNINNTFGHLAGDEVLIGVAKILMKYAREYDVVARFGGEEFAILMPETTPEQAYPIVESMRMAVSNMQFMVPTSVAAIRATTSFGIAGREPGMDGNSIIHNADLALYHAKLKGRNLAFIYSNDGFNSLFRSGQENTEAMEPAPDAIAPGAIMATLQAATQELPSHPKTQKPPEGEQKPESRQAVNDAPTIPLPRIKEKNKPQVFITILAIIALGMLAATGIYAARVDWLGVVVFAVLVAATEWASIDIYVRKTAISVSAVPLIAGVLLFGPVGTLVMAVTLAIVAFIKHHSPFNRFIFNASNQLIAGLTCFILIRLTGLNFLDWPIIFQILVSPLAALLVYSITSLFIAFGIYLTTKIPFGEIWHEQFSWLTPYYVAMGLIAYILIFSYQRFGVFGTLVILVPLAVLRFSQKQFIDRTKDAVTELKVKNKILEEHSDEITRLNDGLLDTLAEVIDLRDPYVLGHSRQVTHYAVLLAQYMALPHARIELIRKSSLMHDVGKLGIDQKLLSKPANLTSEEYEDVKRHVTIGAELLRKSKGLETLIPIVLHHHEHYDGTGYPYGLKGEEISVEARIVCLADALDAMASDRPYRRALSFDEILAEVRRCSGSHFDPIVVQAFEKMIEEKGQSILVNTLPDELTAILEYQPVEISKTL